jgi:hypothetical protein
VALLICCLNEFGKKPGGENEYKTQLGTDIVWADESKLEFVPTENRVKARPVDPRDKHLPKKG